MLYALLARTALDAFLLLRYTLLLLALEGKTAEDRDAAFLWRVQLVAAMVEATPVWLERRILAKIARHESRYNEDVGRCRIFSFDGMGARTAWQIIPMGRAEQRGLCLTPARDAAVAIERVRMSRAMCWRLEPRFQLAAYAAGNCESEAGQLLSEIRWP